MAALALCRPGLPGLHHPLGPALCDPSVCPSCLTYRQTASGRAQPRAGDGAGFAQEPPGSSHSLGRPGTHALRVNPPSLPSSRPASQNHLQNQ